MDWKTIHAYAEEAHLWSSLVVDLWAILSGVYVALNWIRRRTAPSLEQILTAGMISLVLLSMTGAILLLVGPFFPNLAQWAPVRWLEILAISFLGLVGLIYLNEKVDAFLLWWQRRRENERR